MLTRPTEEDRQILRRVSIAVTVYRFQRT